jgi:RHS repeat-associated protein
MALDYADKARNQVAAVSADGPPPIATYTDDLNGNRTQRSLENGIVTNFTYDAARQLLVVDHCTAAGSLVRLGYAYDKLGNRFLYTGREWIAEAGLYDYRNRVYSAELGRFLQADPIRFAGGDINMHRHCNNNGSII